MAEAMDFIPEGKSVKKMRVDYRRAATLGDKMCPVVYIQDDICQVAFLDEEGIPFVIIETWE